MKTFYRFLIILGLLLVGFIAALALLVRIYLKPEKIRNLTISKAETLLGRKVELQKIEVGLFKGILLKGLTIKESDGQTDFVRLKGLRVKFRLLPLLRKKVVITKAEIDSPYLRMVKDRKGVFNWETLKIFQKEDTRREKGQSAASSKGKAFGKAVWTLLIPNFEVRNGKLLFKDETGDLPEMEIPFEVKASLSPEGLSARADFELFKEPFRLVVKVKDFLSAPELEVNLSGQTLDLNPFLKGSGFEKRQVAQAGASRSSSLSSAIFIPVAKAQLELTLTKIIYRKLALLNSRLTATFRDGKLTSDFQGEVAGGKVRGHLEADLRTRVPSWKVRKTGVGIEVAEILAGLYPDLPGQISGQISYEGEFAGAGLSLEEAERTLAGRGRFEIKSLELAGIPATKALARILNLPEIKGLLFSYGRGKFEVKDQRVFLKAELVGPMLSASLPLGTLDFEGDLDMPFDLVFSSGLSKKLTQRLPFARPFLNDKGEVELTVLVKGPYRKPRVILRSRPLERKLKETIEEKLKGLLGL
ncbi:MAG TPA: AsmA family protein [Thermodesulfobacteriaceae bacterium]|nr:AsmA family protein [Thermodesulfobacteriaceae bacterium]